MTVSGANGQILKAMAVLHAMGNVAPTNKEVGLRSGITGASTKRNAFAFLKKNGYIVVYGKTVELTQRGHDAAAELNIELPSSNEKVHEQLKERILKEKLGSKKSTEIFDLLVEHGALTKAEIAEKLGTDTKKSTFRNAFAPLNSVKVVEEKEGKWNLIQEVCFPIQIGE